MIIPTAIARGRKHDVPIIMQVGSYQQSGSVTAPLLQYKPKLHLKLGSITDDMKGRRIKAAIHKAIWTAFESAIEDTIDYGKKIVPESRYRDPPYPPSYSSERLLKKWVAHMEKEAAELASGPNVMQAVYEVQQKWEASYAEYVDDMDKNTNWSKTGSEPNFITTLQYYLVVKIYSHLRVNIKRLPDGTAIWEGT